jgi:cyclase
MLARRVIACLDVVGSRVVKGTAFESLRDAGDPVALAMRYEAEGADEIVFLDIAATQEARRTMLDLVQRTAAALFIPLTVGGGIRSVESMRDALRAGADKVAVNSAAVRTPGLINTAAASFGSQCVVASIDAKRRGDGWRVCIAGGREETMLDAVAWARECAARGAGEILLTSIDRDGARSGYDIALTRAVAETVTVPVIASGGAGRAAHLVDALRDGRADAALVAGVLHDGTLTVAELKRELQRASIPVRGVAA